METMYKPLKYTSADLHAVKVWLTKNSNTLSTYSPEEIDNYIETLINDETALEIVLSWVKDNSAIEEPFYVLKQILDTD